MDQQVSNRLNSLIQSFVQVTLPTAMWEEALSGLYLAGGCVVDLVRNKEPVDYDMFIKSEGLRDSLDTYFHKIAGQHDTTKFKILTITENAVTVRLETGEVVQLVTRFFGPPDRVFSSFDFEHCKSYYDYSSNSLVYNEDVIEKMQLVYTGEKDEFTLNTLKRLCKFVSRGWTPTNDTIFNLHRAIQNRPHIDNESERAMQTIGFYGSSFK